MKDSLQIRLRFSKKAGEKFLALPPRSRSRAVSMMLSAVLENIDLTELLSARRELVSLGSLLNQSLQCSWGNSVDQETLRRIIHRLEGILK